MGATTITIKSRSNKTVYTTVLVTAGYYDMRFRESILGQHISNYSVHLVSPSDALDGFHRALNSKHSHY